MRVRGYDTEDRPEPPRIELPLGGGPVPDALFKSRTILIFGEVDMRMAERVTAQLMALAAMGPEDIRVVINSPGGHVESSDTIHDAVRFCGPAVTMIGTGWVASGGAHIFLAVEKARRVCLPNTRFMLHQPLGGIRGQASDISIQAEEIIKTRARLNGVIARQTGQPIEKVAADTERDFWMSAEEAVAYGLVSRIVERADDV